MGNSCIFLSKYPHHIYVTIAGSTGLKGQQAQGSDDHKEMHNEHNKIQNNFRDKETRRLITNPEM